MGLLKKAMVIGVAKKLYDESRKPHNQKRIQEAVDSFKARRAGRQGPASGGGVPRGPQA